MLTEWVANRNMKKLLNSISNLSIEDEFKMKIEQLKELFFPPFKQEKDCILISETPVDKLEDTFDTAV